MKNQLHHITPEERSLVDVKRLPPQARIIIELIGIEDAWLFFSQYGGRDYRVPTGLNLDTNLHKTLPLASATLLIKKFARQKITVPKPDKIVIQIRNHRIYQARLEGESSAILAKHFNLSRRSIVSICNEMSITLNDHPTS